MKLKFLVFVTLLTVSLATLQAVEPAKPNVLLIILEDWGP